MKAINVNLKEFLECLDIVSNVVPSKCVMPILTNAYIKFEKENITFLGYDTMTSIKKIMFNKEDNFEVIENGEILIDCKTLKAILDRLNCDYIDIYNENNKFVISSDKKIYKLNTVNAEDYPLIKFKKLDNEVDINTKELKNIISKTSFACSQNQKKPILSGVNFILSNNQLRAIATDSFKLSQYKFELENTNQVNFVFPKQSLLVLDKLISKANQDNIKLLYDNDGKNILINFENTLYKTKLLEGTYPNMDRIVDSSKNDKICEINKQDLINAIDRISILTENDNQTIKLIFKNNELEIKNTESAFGNASEIIDCNSDFDLTIVCNYKNLIEALKVFDEENVTFYLLNSSYPFYIKQPNNDNLLELLLPIKFE